MDLPPPPNPNQLPPQNQVDSFNSIFSSKPTPPSVNPDTISQINSLGRRVRMMEEAVMNIRRKIEIQEEDQLKADKRQTNDIQTLFGEVDGMRRQLKGFKDDMVKIIQELQNTAKKEELTAIKKYVELWQPIHFVTQNEVEKIVSHIIDMRLSDKTLFDALLDKKIETKSIESAPINPEHLVDREPEVYSENINRRVKGIKPSDEDEEPEVPARQTPVDKPKPKVSTEAYPPSILHAIANNIENQRKSQSESHIHPDDPGTDIEDVKENKERKKLSSEEAQAYKARIDAILKRKKELHDLLGVK